MSATICCRRETDIELLNRRMIYEFGETGPKQYFPSRHDYYIACQGGDAAFDYEYQLHFPSWGDYTTPVPGSIPNCGVTAVKPLSRAEANQYLSGKKSQFELVKLAHLGMFLISRKLRYLYVQAAVKRTPSGTDINLFSVRLLAHIGQFLPVNLDNRKALPIILAECTCQSSLPLLMGHGFAPIAVSKDNNTIYALDLRHESDKSDVARRKIATALRIMAKSRAMNWN